MFTQKPIQSILVIFCLLFGFSLAYAATLHVPADYETIQAAIDAAEDGDTVLVADGVYFGNGNFNIVFLGKAITVKSENGPEKTVIDCQSKGKGFIFQNSESRSSVVSGFTIKNGKSERFGGGAICCQFSSPTIENNIIKNNTSREGGGIACHSSSPNIINNFFTENFSDGHGGAIYCTNSFSTIAQNVIADNFAHNRGGGVYGESSWLSINNNVIANNSSQYSEGGGIYFGASSSNLTNNTIANNSADARGGGICCLDHSDIVVLNSIILANIADDGENQLYEAGGSNVEVIYSNVQGGFEGEGNIDADPLFVDPENGDYHLQPDSPCIDAGNPHPQYIDPDGTRNDMGAYGGPNAVVPETYPVINEVSPDHGPIAGDTEVTITGENFIDGAAVKFGENEAYDITVVSDTEITASTPATEEVGTVDAAVINPDGQSGVIRDAFSYSYDTETYGSFTISLHKGLNMISLPVKPQTPYTARTLAEELDASIILKYDSVNQEFVPYIPGHSTGDGFTIEGGQGYIVNMLEDKQITFTGTVWDDTAAPKRSLRSARPPRSVVSHCIWAFVVAGKLPVELRNSGDLTVSVSSVNRNLYKELPLSNSKFSVAFVNSDQSPVLKAGDLLEITVTDTDERLVAEQQIVVNVDDLAKAYKLVRLRYNPIPEKTMLLQNYPNPFNPETWIP